MKFDINLILRSKGIQIYGLLLPARPPALLRFLISVSLQSLMLMVPQQLLLLLLPWRGRQQLHCHSRHSPTQHSRPQLYNSTPSVSMAGQDSNHIFFHCNRIPQVPDMFFRGYLYNILVISRPYLKLRELFIFLPK